MITRLRELELDTDPSWVTGAITPLVVKIFCWIDGQIEVRWWVEFVI